VILIKTKSRNTIELAKVIKRDIRKIILKILKLNGIYVNTDTGWEIGNEITLTDPCFIEKQYELDKNYIINSKLEYICKGGSLCKN
jgi:hypothetical protein